MGIPSEQLLAEVSDLLRIMPTVDIIGNGSPAVTEWLGRTAAIIKAWDQYDIKGEMHIKAINSNTIGGIKSGYRELSTFLHQIKYDLGLKTGQLAVAVEQGKVFKYFDQVRQIIESAREDLFFVDPYMDADFVARYMPHVKDGVTVRLLGRDKITALASAAKMFSQESKLNIEVRSSANHHDRFLFVDGRSGHLSGASFKDGAKKATILIQIIDIFNPIYSVYEDMWKHGTAA